MSRFRYAGSVTGVIFVITLGAGLAGAFDTETLPAADWLIATVDKAREVGYNVSVAVDAETGHTYVSYYEGNDGDLWLARTGAPVGNCGPGNTWECQVLDSDGIVGKYSSIAVGGAGTVAELYISYHDVTSGSLKVVEGSVDRTTGALTYQTYRLVSGNPAVEIFVGTATSIEVDDTGMPHIVYQELTRNPDWWGVRYATRVAPGTGSCGPGDEWTCTLFHGSVHVADFVDIELDPNGVPIIAFSDHNLGTPVIATPVPFGGGDCWYSDEWDCQWIMNSSDATGNYLSLAIAGDGVPHLAYHNEIHAGVEWARYVGSGGNCGSGSGVNWECREIDFVGPTGPSGVGIEIDNFGQPVIAYHRISLGVSDLRIARPLAAAPWALAGNCGPFGDPWYCETLDQGDDWHDEAYGGLSMTMRAGGDAVVAYRELFDPPAGPAEGRLKVALEPISIFLDGFESGNTSRWSVTVP